MCVRDREGRGGEQRPASKGGVAPGGGRSAAGSCKTLPFCSPGQWPVQRPGRPLPAAACGCGELQARRAAGKGEGLEGAWESGRKRVHGGKVPPPGGNPALTLAGRGAAEQHCQQQQGAEGRHSGQGRPAGTVARCSWLRRVFGRLAVSPAPPSVSIAASQPAMASEGRLARLRGEVEAVRRVWWSAQACALFRSPGRLAPGWEVPRKQNGAEQDAMAALSPSRHGAMLRTLACAFAPPANAFCERVGTFQQPRGLLWAHQGDRRAMGGVGSSGGVRRRLLGALGGGQTLLDGILGTRRPLKCGRSVPQPPLAAAACSAARASQATHPATHPAASNALHVPPTTA